MWKCVCSLTLNDQSCPSECCRYPSTSSVQIMHPLDDIADDIALGWFWDMPINLLDYPHAHTHRWIHTDADIPCMHISVRPHKSTQIYEKWTPAAIVNSTFSYLLFSHSHVGFSGKRAVKYLLQYLPTNTYTRVKSWPSFVRGECMPFLRLILSVSFFRKGLERMHWE